MCYFTNFLVSMVELRRVELLTSCLQGRRSSQLSYSPKYYLIINIIVVSINLLLITII